MSAKKSKTLDYKSLSSRSKENGAAGDATLKPAKSLKKETDILHSLENPVKKSEADEAVKIETAAIEKFSTAELVNAQKETPKIETSAQITQTFAEQQKQRKTKKLIEKDQRLLS